MAKPEAELGAKLGGARGRNAPPTCSQSVGTKSDSNALSCPMVMVGASIFAPPSRTGGRDLERRRVLPPATVAKSG